MSPTESDISVGRYLGALFGDAPTGSYIEVRFRTETGMGRAFYGTTDLYRAATMILRLAPTTDVYVGVLPRARQASGRDALVAKARLLWTDCDKPSSVAALADFTPEASLVVASGSGTNRHAYWLLKESVSCSIIENANHAIASALGSDVACSDAARILRPPSLNHKHAPPSAVVLIRCELLRPYALEEIVPLPAEYTAASNAAITTGAARQGDDALLQIAPARYVEELSGARVGSSRKIACPFHPDDTPSLHVYRDPARGWYCYGCRRGGSIYDFAALSFGMTTDGQHFPALRDRLLAIFADDHAGGIKS